MLHSPPVSPRPGRSLLVGAVAALTMAFGALAAVPASAEPLAEPADAQLVAHYPLDETSGTVVADASGNGRNAELVNNAGGTATWLNGRGLRLPGGNSSNLAAFPAVKLPDSLLAGLDDATITYDVLASGTAAGGPVFTFGQNSDNGGYLTGSPGNVNSTSTVHQASIAGPGNVAQASAAPAGLARNVWKHVAVVIDGGDAATPGSMRLYEDGVVVATNDALTIKPSDITSPTSYIGRSNVTFGHRPAVRRNDQGLPRVLEHPRGLRGGVAVGCAGARQPAGDAGRRRPRRHERRRGEPHAPDGCGDDLEHQRPERHHGDRAHHPARRGRGGCIRHPDGDLHPSRADGFEGLRDHGQEARGVLGRGTRRGPRAPLRARRDHRHDTCRLRKRGRGRRRRTRQRGQGDADR